MSDFRPTKYIFANKRFNLKFQFEILLLQYKINLF